MPKNFVIYGESQMKSSANVGDVISFNRVGEDPEWTCEFMAMCPLYPGDEVLLAWPDGRDPGEITRVRRDGQIVYPEPVEEIITQEGPGFVL